MTLVLITGGVLETQSACLKPPSKHFFYKGGVLGGVGVKVFCI